MRICMDSPSEIKSSVLLHFNTYLQKTARVLKSQAIVSLNMNSSTFDSLVVVG